MKLLHYSLICAFGALCTLAPIERAFAALPDISQQSKPATIKVLVVKRAPNALLEIKGRYQLYNPLNGLGISSGITGKRHTVAPHEQGIRWGDLFQGIYQIRLVPGDSQSYILVNGIQYRGCVEVYNIEDTINVVNEVDIENFLKSTLTGQFSSDIGTEVMDAVAIVARTNAYYLAQRNPGAFWHIEGHDVGYQGHGITSQNLYVDRAIETTRHMVLTYHSAPFAAMWTSDSAGKTAEFSTIFRKEVPSPTGVTAPLAGRDREKHAWSFSIPKAQLAKIAKTSDVSGVDVYLDNHSGKVYGVRVSDREVVQDIDFFALQKGVGKNKLLSNDFKISVKGDSIVFNGYGEGHGVGLCLYSAGLMAKHGENANKILAAFFPNTKLERIRILPQTDQPIGAERSTR